MRNGGTQDQSSSQSGTQSGSQRSSGSFSQLDTNGDGRISRSEAAGDRNLNGSFTKADRNGDGYIDASEYRRQGGSSSESNSGPGG